MWILFQNGTALQIRHNMIIRWYNNQTLLMKTLAIEKSQRSTHRLWGPRIKFCWRQWNFRYFQPWSKISNCPFHLKGVDFSLRSFHNIMSDVLFQRLQPDPLSITSCANICKTKARSVILNLHSNLVQTNCKTLGDFF